MFTNREQAAKLLAAKLQAYKKTDSVIIGLARGGVVVASVLSQALNIPFDVLVVRKISSPEDPELGIGAYAPDGATYIDWKLAHIVGADEAYVKEKSETLSKDVKVTIQAYRKVKKPVSIERKTVILTDDGVATGATIQAAIKWVHAKKVKDIVLALPVAPSIVVSRVQSSVKEVAVLESPADLQSVGEFYESFDAVENDTVLSILAKKA